MASNIVVPETLKQVKPYVTLSDQLDQKGDKIAAYYCRLYAVQTGMSINKTAPDCKKFLLQFMDILEKNKTQLKGDETLKDDSVAQAFMEKYVLIMFKKADDDDRAGRFSRNLIKQYYTAGLLFDVLNTFGDLSEDLVQMKKYAKMKAMYIKKCLDNNETPISGPLITDEDNVSAALGNYHFTNENESSSHSEQPAAPSRPAPPAAAAAASTYYEAPAADKKASSPQKIGAEAIVQAQKLCKFATNALQYEDVPTAIENLEKCLKLLKTGK